MENIYLLYIKTYKDGTIKVLNIENTGQENENDAK